MKERTGTQNRINKKVGSFKKIKIDKHLAQWTKKTPKREALSFLKAEIKLVTLVQTLWEVKRTIRAYKNCNQIR